MQKALTAIFVTVFLAAPAAAQDLTGTLKRVADSGEFRIGYVPDAPPMSYDGEDGKPVGYSIALCRNIATAVRDLVGVEELKLSFIPLVLPEERIAAVMNHTVDIECGASTITLSRRQQVDFSLMTFITGGAVLSLNGNAINSVEELTGKTIAVIKGTTTHAAIRGYITTNDFKITLRIISTHNEGMELLNAGKVDGYASDRAMLLGQVVRSGDRSKYVISRDVFSFEPYGLMLARGDTDFRLVVDRALARLYGTARIRRIYQDWIGRYGEPMSPILSAMYEFQAVGE